MDEFIKLLIGLMIMGVIIEIAGCFGAFLSAPIIKLFPSKYKTTTNIFFVFMTFMVFSLFFIDFYKTKPDEKEFKMLDEKSYEFTDYFHKHRIYFNEDICSKVDELVKALYSAYVPLEMKHSNDDKLQQVWIKCAEVVQKQYPNIKDSLESDFRKILGVAEK